MNTPRVISPEWGPEGEGRAAVERYIEEVCRLYLEGGAVHPAHEKFLRRMVSTLPTLSEDECMELAKALATPRLSTLARAVAEIVPTVLA